MKVCDWINISLSIPGVVEKLFDGDIALEVEDRHVRLHSGTVQGGGSGLAAVLAGLVPWRSANREALRGGDDGVESVEGWAGDES